MWGTPRKEEGLLKHSDILWMIDGYEPERGVGVAGHRAYFLKGNGLLLNMALVQYGTHFLMKRQYTMLQPPYFMNKDVMDGVAQLEEYDEALYKVTGEEGDDKYLIATSEQPICAYHKDEIIGQSQLPKRYGGISTCFRKEAGSHGRDTWGIFRVHQFEKVEQFVVCEPSKSEAMVGARCALCVRSSPSHPCANAARGDDRYCEGVLPVSRLGVPRHQHRVRRTQQRRREEA